MSSATSLFKFLSFDKSSFIKDMAKLTHTKPYAYQVWVYSCVSVIANNLSSLGKYLYNKRTEEKITDHPLLSLFNKTNPETFGKTFFESIIIHLMLEGQTFVLPDNKQNLAAGAIPKELYVIKDEYMSAKSNKNNIIDRWVYRPSAKDITYDASELIRLRLYNPYDCSKGLAPISSAMATIMQDANAAAYTANFFSNNAQIGGVLSTPDKITEEQAKFIAKQFSEKYSGVDKAGKTPVLHSGLSYQAISSTFKDMQFKDQQEFIKERILAAFKVPKSLVADYSQVNYSNSITAKKTFWQEGLLPIDKLINEAFTYQWVSGADPDLVLLSDLSQVEALQDIQGERVSAYKTLIDSGLPPEEAARLVNIPVDWENVAEIEANKEDEPTPEEVVEEVVEDEEKAIDIHAYTKTLKSALNRYFTKLRNKCLDKIDAGKQVDYTVEEEFNRMVIELKTAYLTLINTLVEDIKDVDVTASDIVGFLNERSDSYKQLLTNILSEASKTTDKTAMHEMFQSNYKTNKELAEVELDVLIDFIRNVG